MSNSNRWRVPALALLCCASSGAFAAKAVDVQPQSFPLSTNGKAAVKAAPIAPLASPVVFRIDAVLDEHGHVKAECHEHANPKFDATRSVRERGPVQEHEQ
jgi:hypothetical protein